ncbi:acetylcholine receptor subunit alpha-like [Babylonia areolata]|uniref:acetylcholine receptor subunit alpha-like n=1 Tax=Babylonia areolata TaxID=304850 RepID=UPI003FD5B36E
MTNTINIVITVISILFNIARLLHVTSAQSGENFTKIHQDIIKIDKRVRPVKNWTTITNVSVSFHLMSIIQFDTVEQKLVSNGWLFVQWKNEYTTWNPYEYENAWSVSPDPDKVWRPMLTVQNTMTNMRPMGEEYIAMLLLFDGTTYWFPAERFETFCEVDVTYFPFDIQKCRWIIFIWGGDGSNIDIHPINDVIDLESYAVNGEWDLRSTRGWREVAISDGSKFITLFYEITIRRRPSLLALTVLLPVLVLALVNVFVFTIPSEAGERLAYSMTALLSFGVFMSFILDSMPSSTETLSIVAVNMSCLLVLSAVYVLLCILSLRLFHRDPSKHPVPAFLQSVIVWLEMLVCLDPPNKKKVADVFQMPTPMMTVTDFPGDQSLMVSGGQAGGATKKGKLRGQLDKWARARNRNHAAYADPAEMTWKRVSRTLDKILFRFFLTLVVVSNTVVWAVMISNYYE